MSRGSDRGSFVRREESLFARGARFVSYLSFLHYFSFPFSCSRASLLLCLFFYLGRDDTLARFVYACASLVRSRFLSGEMGKREDESERRKSRERVGWAGLVGK